MKIEVGKTRLVDTVKVRESGGRSLEVTIPKSVVESMDLKKDDQLIVLEDKERHRFVMYVNPKKSSIDIDNLEQGLSLYSPFSIDEMEKIIKKMKKKEK